MDAGVILLRDKAGEKLSIRLVGTIKRTSTVNILRGELLVPIPGDKIVPRNDGKKPHNYRVKGDPTVTLLCREDYVAPLSNYEFLLLEGIQSRDTRYQAFISSDYLDFGLNLKPGADVYVVLPGFSSGGNTAVTTPATPRAAAKVRYVGGLGSVSAGLMFGIEIVEKKYFGRGTTDGTYQNQRYFQCRDNCGLFVSLEKLSPDREGSTLAKASPGGQEYETGSALNNPEQGPKGGSSHDMIPRSKAKKCGQDSSVDPPPRQFGIGDRVKVYNKKGIAVHGTLRWVGRNTAIREFQHTVVGIETDVPVRKEEFEFYQPGMTHLFTVKDRKCQLCMPEFAVVDEFDQAVDIQGGQQKLSAQPLSQSQSAAQPPGQGAHQQPSAHPQPAEQPGHPQIQYQEPQAYTHPPVKLQHPHHQLSIGSTVQLFNPPQYGVIRWVGDLPGVSGRVAGVEMEEDLDGCTDGTWRVTGRKYFHCPPGRGMYCPLGNLKPDHRFTEPGAVPGSAVMKNPTKDDTVKLFISEQNQEYEDKLSHQKEQISHLQARVAAEEEGRVHLEQAISHLREEMVRNERQLNLEKQQLQEECTRLQQQLEIAVRGKQNLQGEYSILQRENSNVYQQLEQERHQATVAEQDFRQEIQHLQGQVRDALAEVQQLRSAPQLASPSQQDGEPWNVPRSEVLIQEPLGVGGWGSVNRGIFRGQYVAIKQPHAAILNPSTINRLQREARIMAQVRHPNLVRFIAAVFDNQTPPLIIIELLSTNLRTAYETRRLDNSMTIKLPIFRDVAYGLHYLHEHQEPIIHRDVSAPNVLLETLPNGMWRAKVSDFGSANIARLAQTMAEGAIIYAAPETIPQMQLDPHAPPPPQTTKIDVYSYGVLLCEVITCQLPDPQEYSSMLRTVQKDYPHLHSLIVWCAVRHNPHERPTMAQVLDELEKIPLPRPRQRPQQN